MALRDEMIRTISSVGMLRRDVAADIADAIIQTFSVSYSACRHEHWRAVLTEVGPARQCIKCGFQNFTE